MNFYDYDKGFDLRNCVGIEHRGICLYQIINSSKQGSWNAYQLTKYKWKVLKYHVFHSGRMVHVTVKPLDMNMNIEVYKNYTTYMYIALCCIELQLCDTC